MTNRNCVVNYRRSADERTQGVPLADRLADPIGIYKANWRIDMGAGSQQARTFWLRNLIKEIESGVNAKGCHAFPPPRQDGAVPLSRIVELLGHRGILVRQPGIRDDALCFAARSVERLGITEQAS